MSFHSRGPVLAQLHAAFEKPLRFRCIEIDKILHEYSYKDLSCCLPLIVESVFGFGIADTSATNWQIERIVKQHGLDFSKLLCLLGPEGPLLQVIFQLSSDPSCRYEFPINCLPEQTRALIDAGTLPPFYQDKVQISPSGKPLDVIYLGAFEFYMFHFAYFLVNVQAQASSRMMPWNKPDECFYPVLLETYLKYFFPLDSSSSSSPAMTSQVPRAVSPINAAAHFSNVSPRYPNAVQSPSGYPYSLLHDLHLPLAASSPIGKYASSSATLGCSDEETWRSEILLQILVDFYLGQNASIDCGNSMVASYTSSMLSQTGNHMRMVRVLVKHLHYFVNSVQHKRNAQYRHQVLPQWEDLKRRVWPQIVQRKLYIFLRHNFEWWPLDAMFRLVLETWLSYIQPWRYCVDSSQGAVDGQEFSEANEGSLDDKWRQFVIDNLLFYSVLGRSFLQRALRMDLSASKNAFMLLRMSKVFALPNLVDVLIEAESAVPDTSFSERVGQIPATRRPYSPSDLSGCRFANNVTNSLTAQITELEGPRYEYQSLFHQIATDRMVMQLLEMMETAATNDAVSAAQAASESINVSWMEWLFGSNVDYNTSKYFYYNDEGFENGTGLRTTEAYLEQAAANLCAIFQLERKRKSLIQSGNEQQRLVRRGCRVDPPDVDCVDGVPVLTPLGRTQLMNGLRRFEIEYEGDPDLQPIRSFECAFLVRALYALSCYINNRFSPFIISSYSRRDFFGRLMRHVMQPPTVGSSPLNVDRLNCMSPSAQDRVVSSRCTPRLSLRRLATYRAVVYLLLLYVVLFAWRNAGLFEYSLVVFTIFLLYFVMKTIVSEPPPAVAICSSRQRREQ